MASRDRYADVGKATRLAIRKALDAHAPPYALRDLLAVIDQTTTWSVFEARTTRPYLADVTGQGERQVTRGMAWLVANGVLEWDAGRIVDGRAIASRVRLPRDTPCPEDKGHQRARARDTGGPHLGTPRVPDTRIIRERRHDERLAASSADARNAVPPARCAACGSVLFDDGNGPECSECAA